MAELVPMGVLDAAGKVVVSVVMAHPGYDDGSGNKSIQVPDGSYVNATWDGETLTKVVEETLVVAPPTPAQLTAHANSKQDRVLASQWHFDLGTAGAPLVVSTRLDVRGQLSMHKIAKWTEASPLVPATLPYINIDGTPLTLTQSQAATLIKSVTAIDMQTFQALSDVMKGILATPPTITTTAQIDAAAWPVPTAP